MREFDVPRKVMKEKAEHGFLWGANDKFTAITAWSSRVGADPVLPRKLPSRQGNKTITAVYVWLNNGIYGK